MCLSILLSPKNSPCRPFGIKIRFNAISHFLRQFTVLVNAATDKKKRFVSIVGIKIRDEI